MITIQLRAFLEAHVFTCEFHRPRANVNPRVLREPRTITDLKEAIREEMRAIPRSLCKDVMDSFVLRLKKCTELNGGHLEHKL